MSMRTAQRRNVLAQTWRDFHRALRSPQPFNPFVWIYRLTAALLEQIHVASGCADFVARNEIYKKTLALIPLFGVTLNAVVIVCYFYFVRAHLALRWCCPGTQDGNCATCLWMHLHDFLSTYFSIMILFHYIACTFRSPGVVLPPREGRPPYKWKAKDRQGGILGWNATCNEAAERKCLALYGDLVDPMSGRAIVRHVPSTCRYYPSPDTSFCGRCRVLRPPRSHHCSVSDRCVLQFDHHCLWVNQNIGFNNYRNFILMLFYLSLGCIYGGGLLFFPVFESVKNEPKQHGGFWLFSSASGLLNLPPVSKFGNILFSGKENELAVLFLMKLGFALLLCIGIVITWFFSFHVKYVLSAKTTLEHKIMLDDSMSSILQSGRERPSTVNPFDQGVRKNVRQILGPNLFLILLPLSISPPPPYIPGESHDR